MSVRFQAGQDGAARRDRLCEHLQNHKIFPMTPNPRDRLLQVFRERAVSFGNFTLASGKQSTYYINSKKAIFHAEAAWLLAEVLFEMSPDFRLDAVGGLEVGALPLAAVLAQRYHTAGKALEGFFVRKQAKAHGSQE